MNFNQLHYFISVAKFLNFTKAAQHHYISQTAISRQIIALEQELGLELFYRNKRNVNLTAAGQVFFTEACRIISILDNAKKSASLVNAKPTGLLKVGYYGPADKFFLPKWIKNFQSTYPDISLELFKQSNENMIEVLTNGEVDLLLRLSNALLINQINSKISYKSICKLPSDSLCAVVYSSHLLAKKKLVHFSDFKNENLVFFDNKSNPLSVSLLLNECRDAGFSPTIISESSSAETLLLLVEAEAGITILPQCYKSHATENVCFIKLGDKVAHPPTLLAVWDPNNLNPTLPLFLNMTT